MSCCGKKRSHLHLTAAGSAVSAAAPKAHPAPSVLFEYTGESGLTIRSPLSGRGYRVQGAGSRFAVDPRDAPLLAAIPNLRRVRG